MNIKKHNWINLLPNRVHKGYDSLIEECSNCGMISFIKNGQRSVNMSLLGIKDYSEVPSCEEFKTIVIERGLKKNCQRSFINTNCSDSCIPMKNGNDFFHVEKKL